MALPTETFDNTTDLRNYVQAHIIENNTRSISEEHINNILNSVLNILDLKDLKIGVSSVTDGVSGSLLYVDATGKLGQTDYLFFDNTNDRLGVGITAPVARLDIAASAANCVSVRVNSGVAPSILYPGSLWFSGSSFVYANYMGQTRNIISSSTTLTNNTLAVCGTNNTISSSSFLTVSGSFLTATGTIKTISDSIGLLMWAATSGDFLCGIGFCSAGGGVSKADIKINHTTKEFRIGGVYSGYFPTFYSSNSEAMRISADGYIGIGVTSPTAKVHIGGATTSAASLCINSGVAPTTPNDGDIWYDGTYLYFREGSTTKKFTLTT